jgi:hypothetical protein
MSDDRLTFIGLAAEGFGGGDPDAVAEMPVRTVAEIAAYSKFKKEFAETHRELNKPEPKR